jgi:NitT/TauT family transport system substrate-binding protein
MNASSLPRLAFGLLTSACVLSAHAEDPRKLRFALDWVFQGPQAPFLVPHENGCYKRVGLDVTTDRGYGSGDTVVKVGSGAYDVGFADLNAMVEYNARQQKPEDRLISFFMIYDGAALSIISRKDTGITKPSDLVGKTIAAPPGDASRRLFPALAQANGFDAAGVKWMNVAPELRETMLVRKQADAISGAAFTGYMGVRAIGLEKDQIVVMRYPEFGSSLYGSALVARRSFAEQNGPALTALVECVAEGFATSVRQPEVAISALHQRDGLINRQVEQERMQLSLDWSVVTPWVRKNGMGQVDPARLKKSMQEVSTALTIPQPDVAEVYTTKYLPPAGKLAIAR